MIPYYVILTGAVVLGSLLSVARKQGMGGNTDSARLGRIASIVLLIAVALWFIVPSGLRFGVGEDYWRYVSNYYGIYREPLGLADVTDEPGIRLLTGFSIWLRDGTATFFMLASALTVVPIIATLYRQSPYIALSLYFFITTLAWQESFNIVRQCIAAALVFIGYRYILDRQFSRFALLVFCAMLFHVSAVLLLALYFLPRRQLRPYELVLGSVMAVGILGSYALIEPFVDDAVLGSTYFVEEVNPLRIGLAWLPVVVYWIFSRKSTLTPEGHFLANVMIVNGLGAIAAMDSAYLTRMLLYTGLFSCLAIPVILKGVPQSVRHGIAFALVVIYGLAWGLVTSASTALSPFVWVVTGT